MSYEEDLASARYIVETAWKDMSSDRRHNIKTIVQKIITYAKQHYDDELYRKSLNLERLIKQKNASLSLKEFDSGDRVQLTAKCQGYVKGTVAYVEVYDWTTGACNIRIQRDYVLLRNVPANKLKLQKVSIG